MLNCYTLHVYLTLLHITKCRCEEALTTVRICRRRVSEIPRRVPDMQPLPFNDWFSKYCEKSSDIWTEYFMKLLHSCCPKIPVFLLSALNMCLSFVAKHLLIIANQSTSLNFTWVTSLMWGGRHLWLLDWLLHRSKLAPFPTANYRLCETHENGYGLWYERFLPLDAMLAHYML